MRVCPHVRQRTPIALRELLKSAPHRHCNDNITDVIQEVILHNNYMQHILPYEINVRGVLLCANVKKNYMHEATPLQTK